MSNEYIIGIDAGGTKTTAQAYDINGNLLETACGDFGNVTLDFDRAMKNITSAVDELLSKLSKDNCKFICLGCSGIETGDKKKAALEFLNEKYGDIVYVTNDAMLALYSALKGKDGILTIAGTGSIGYLKKGDTVERFGGWGHLINDDGSGYSIAIKAIRFIAYSFDSKKSETPLKKAFFKYLNITELRELIDFTYNSTKGQIASLVPVVEEIANEGDFQAKEILMWAGERVANLAINLARQNHIVNPNIAISGSVIKKTAIAKKAFINELKTEIKDFTLFDEDFNPTKGAYYIYMDKSKSFQQKYK